MTETARPLIAHGRDADIFALGQHLVLRRLKDGRCVEGEARAMEYVRAAGFPVPRALAITSDALVMERVNGPTMLEDLLHRPWRLAHHARRLAELHHRLHRIPAPTGMVTGPVPGNRVVHLDLHPGNVILGHRGPVVIDWTHACAGDPASDIALTWTSLGCFEHDATGIRGLLADAFRRRFLESFLLAAGKEHARQVLPAIVRYRVEHPLRSVNIRPGERDALLALAAQATRPRPPDSTSPPSADEEAGRSGLLMAGMPGLELAPPR